MPTSLDHDPLADLTDDVMDANDPSKCSDWPFEVKAWPQTIRAIHSEWFDPKPYTFTIPIRTREPVVIPLGALVRANPGFLRRML